MPQYTELNHIVSSCKRLEEEIYATFRRDQADRIVNYVVNESGSDFALMDSLSEQDEASIWRWRCVIYRNFLRYGTKEKLVEDNYGTHKEVEQVIWSYECFDKTIRGKM